MSESSSSGCTSESSLSGSTAMSAMAAEVSPSAAMLPVSSAVALRRERFQRVRFDFDECESESTDSSDGFDECESESTDSSDGDGLLDFSSSAFPPTALEN